MKFLYPHILYFLFLLIIPIIIHLFNFRRYKKLYFPSLQFIKKIEKETNSVRNLRNYIILSLRMLAFAALIIAFAQPYFNNGEQSTAHNNVIPVYLDNSFSMAAKGSNGDLLNQAKTVLREITDNYPKSQKYILVSNSLDGSEHRVINKTELEDKLDNVSFSPISRYFTNPIESLKEYLQSLDSDGNFHYYVISDFQKRFLNNPDAKLDTSATYTLLQLTPQIKSNLYIDSVWFEQPFQRVNKNNTFFVRVQNTGDKKLTNVEIYLKAGEIKRQTLIDIEPENNTTVAINFTDRTTGIKEGVVEVADENLFFDNKFHFSYEVKENVNVLIINDDNSPNLPKLVFQTDDFYNVSETAVQQIKTEELSNSELIVLNSLKRISSGMQTHLHQLVSNGVYLFIIPAADFDEESYRQLYSSFHLPVFKEAVQQEIRIGKIATDFSFFAGMFDKKIDQLRLPPLKNYFSSTVYTNANYNSLIQYENGMTLLAETGKENNVTALYTAINPEFNDFGKSALFASVLLRAGKISQGKNPLNITIGSSDEFKVNVNSTNESAVILKKDEIEFIPEMTKQSGFTFISVRNAIDNQSIEDGVYQIIQSEKEIGKIALNYNRLESDMDFADKNEIENYFKSLNIKNIDAKGISDQYDISNLAFMQTGELWKIFVVLASIFFLLEMLVAMFWKI